MNIESLKDRWLEAMITGPTVGTFLRPVTFGLKKIIKIGERKAFNKV